MKTIEMNMLYPRALATWQAVRRATSALAAGRVRELPEPGLTDAQAAAGERARLEQDARAAQALRYF